MNDPNSPLASTGARKPQGDQGAGSGLRVAFIFPVGNIHAAPSVINSVECLARAGMEVDVFIPRNTLTQEVRFGSPRVRVLLSPWSTSQVREARVLGTLAFCGWLLFRPGWRYDFVFVAGLRSVIVAWVLGRVRRMRIVNLQLELYIGRKLSVIGREWIKRVERSVVKGAHFSIIQDERRAELMSGDLGVDRSRIELVPNGPLGPARLVRTDFLHRRLGLAPNFRVLLCPGTICEAMLGSAIVRAAQFLPEGWVCVMHSSLSINPDNAYLRELYALNTDRRVVFSLDPVPYEEVGELFASASVGLALYGESGGQNTVEVGLASGKLIHFLKCGVPVIVSDVGLLGRFVEARRVGVAVNEPANLGTAVVTVTGMYDEFSRNAVEVFNRELAFDARFATVIERMKRAITNDRPGGTESGAN